MGHEVERDGVPGHDTDTSKSHAVVSKYSAQQKWFLVPGGGSQDIVCLRRDGAVVCLEASEVLTIAHNFKPRYAGQLCFYEGGKDELIEDFVAGVLVEVPGAQAGSSQDVEIEGVADVPAADGEAEEPPA